VNIASFLASAHAYARAYARRRPLVAAGAGAGLLVCVGWLFFSGESAPHLVTAPVTRGDIERSVTALGTVQPKVYVDVGAQVSGQLTKLFVDIGDEVEQGDLLAVIDPKVIESKVAAATAQLAALQAQLTEQAAQHVLARSQAERARTLKAVDAISQDELESGLAALKVAEARMQTLRAQIKAAESSLQEMRTNLGYTNIYAPMSGTVISKNALVGQTLNANQQAPVILRLANLKAMTVWAKVAEADVVKLKPGVPAYFTTLGTSGRRWKSRVDQVLPTPEVVNDVVLYNVLLDTGNDDGVLLPQMSAQVFFMLEEARNALLVPSSALVPVRGGRAYEVRLLVDGRSVTKPVKVGVQSRTHAQILEGLKEGDLVVTGARSAPRLKENDRGPGQGGGRGRGAFRGGLPL
jgi:macrolide-specific efflux system membrane fusion protein